MGHRLRTVSTATVSAALVGMSFAGLSAGAASGSASKSPVTIALITSETGLAGPEYGDANLGFLARIAQQNAAGGVNGRKIVPLVIDDQSSPTTVVTGVQDAISR